MRFSAVLGRSRLILLHARGIELHDCQLARQCLHGCEKQVNASVHLLLPLERVCAVVHVCSVLPIKPRHRAHNDEYTRQYTLLCCMMRYSTACTGMTAHSVDKTDPGTMMRYPHVIAMAGDLLILFPHRDGRLVHHTIDISIIFGGHQSSYN